MKSIKNILYCIFWLPFLSGIGNANAQIEQPSPKVTEAETVTENLPPAICRIWHGWTTVENADKFEQILTKEVIPGFEKNKPKGYQGIQLLRRDIGEGIIEFTTHMWFDSIESVKGFAGKDYETA